MRRWIVLALLIALPALSWGADVRWHTATLEALEEADGDLPLAKKLGTGIFGMNLFGVTCGDQRDYIVRDGGATEPNIYVLRSCGNPRRISKIRIVAIEGNGIKIRPFGEAWGDTAVASIISASSDSLRYDWDSVVEIDSLRIWIGSGAGLVSINAF